MEQHSLEHGLAQKLMIMENAAAKVATLRAQLRASVDQARKEVRAVMSQQMLLIRAREQELLDELDIIMNHKDGKLELQQQSLYKNIWECKQALEKIREGGSATSTVDILARIDHVELSSRETAHVSFESDAIELRSKLLSFGSIRTSSRHDDANKTTAGESLPMEMEEYDDALMAHKSVLPMKTNPPTSSNMSRQQVESVRKWLKKIPSGPGALDADVSTIMAEFDVIKNCTPEAEVESSDSASSFDIVAQDNAAQSVSAENAEKVLSAEFLNTLQQPLSTWLMRIMPSEPSKGPSVTAIIGETVRSMKRPHSCGDIKNDYGFQNVIRSVNDSNDDAWILGTEPTKKTRTQYQPEQTEDNLSSSEQECETQSVPAFNESEFVSHLSKLFLCNSATTSPESRYGKFAGSGVDLTTILGWKQVLDRIEQSAPYWLIEKK